MLGVAVLCAETEERARWLAGSGALAMARLRQGRPGVYPTPEEAAEHVYTPRERQIIGPWRESHVVGDPDQVRRGLVELVERTGADELIITTMAHGYEDRVRSYELVAEAVGLESVDVGLESVDVGLESVDVGLESVDVGLESVDVGLDPIGHG